MTWQSEVRAWVLATAGTFALSAIGYRVWTAPAIPDLAPVTAKLSAAADGLTGTTEAATTLLRTANGTVAAAKTIPAHLNAVIDLTSHRLNDLCPTVDAAIRPCGTLADTNRTLATLRGTSGQVEIAVHRFDDHEDALFAQELTMYASGQAAADGLRAVATNPDIPATIANVRTMSAAGAAVGTSVAGRVKKFSLWKPWTW